MVKSSLTTAVYDFGTKKSSPRNQKISCITPHHCAGTLSPLEYAKSHLSSNRKASSNYYIKDDIILCAVSEDRRAWTSGDPSGIKKGGATNDHRAITIEVSNSSSGGRWPISDKSYRSLVRLCADVCKRYSFVPHFDGTTSGSITMHKQFGATACPGPYLEDIIRSHKFENDILAEMHSPIVVPTTPAKEPENANYFPKVPFLVRVKIPDLYIKAAGNPQAARRGFIKKGTYTIVEVNSNGFGRLKSGAGWIYITNPNYVEIVR